MGKMRGREGLSESERRAENTAASCKWGKENTGEGAHPSVI